MSTFSKHQTISASPLLIPDMAEAICREFRRDGHEVCVENLYSGGKDISITKGGAFKAVLGMKTALKVTLQPRGDSVLFDANVGIFGQQAIPTVISMLVFWPVLITQISGLIMQSQMDDRAFAAAESVCRYATPKPSNAGGAFCPACGKPVAPGAHFCSSCGAKL